MHLRGEDAFSNASSLVACAVQYSPPRVNIGNTSLAIYKYFYIAQFFKF